MSFDALFFSPKKIKEQEAVAIFLKKGKKQDLTPVFFKKVLFFLY